MKLHFDKEAGALCFRFDDSPIDYYEQ